MTEDEMVGWHHQLNGHEFEQILGDGEGQGSLVYCSSWGHKELDMTEQLTRNNPALNVSGPCRQASHMHRLSRHRFTLVTSFLLSHSTYVQGPFPLILVTRAPSRPWGLRSGWP